MAPLFVYFHWLWLVSVAFLPRRTSSDFFLVGVPHRYGFVSISIAAPLTTQQFDGDGIEFSIMILLFLLLYNDATWQVSFLALAAGVATLNENVIRLRQQKLPLTSSL